MLIIRRFVLSSSIIWMFGSLQLKERKRFMALEIGMSR